MNELSRPRALATVLFLAATFAVPDVGAADSLIKACAAPPLPAPSGAVVRVSTEPELQAAVGALRSETTILIAPGTYRLTSSLFLNSGVTNVAIRGDSDSCDEVVLVGRGMSNADYGNVPHGIWIGAAQNVLVANLTIQDVYFHPIQLEPSAGAQSPRIYNVHMIDAGQQFIKSSDNQSGSGVDNGIVEYCTMEYTTTARSNYTNGVDVHKGANWIVRHNLFRNIRAPAGQLAGPAVLMWNRSRDSIVEGNLFLNVQYGIALGLNGSVADDHSGGIVRNNFFHRKASESGDVAITINNSAGTQVLHNTIILNGTYPNAIEYRFPATTGVEVRYNLSDSNVQARDGASGVASDNVTSAPASWFVDAAAGDLHLRPEAAGAIDRARPHADVADDYDLRPRSDGSPDLGADELETDVPDPDPPPDPPIRLRLVPR